MDSVEDRRHSSPGLPHSEILGSRPACGSPRLIAASYVLRRLLMPGHSPYTLSSLTRSHFAPDTHGLSSRPIHLSKNSNACAFALRRGRYASQPECQVRIAGDARCIEAVALGPRFSVESELLRKEVFQPQVPQRLPCYDFTPIIGHTVGACLLAVGCNDFRYNKLSWCDGRCVQGPGTYSPRRADPRLLAIPPS
jgi:hypothetical protein